MAKAMNMRELKATMRDYYLEKSRAIVASYADVLSPDQIEPIREAFEARRATFEWCDWDSKEDVHEAAIEVLERVRSVIENLGLEAIAEAAEPDGLDADEYLSSMSYEESGDTIEQLDADILAVLEGLAVTR